MSTILFIHQSSCVGGAGVMLGNIIKILVENGHRIKVICPNGDGNNLLRLAGADVINPKLPVYQCLHTTGSHRAAINPLFWIPLLRLWRNRQYWIETIKNENADTLCINAITLIPYAMFGKRAGKKVLCIIQETAVPGLLGFRNYIMRRMLKRFVDKVWFISEYESCKYNLGSVQKKVIPNWIRSDFLNSNGNIVSIKRKYGIDEDCSVVLMMGGIEHIKGTLEFVKAISLLKGRINFKVVISGSSSGINFRTLSNFGKIYTAVRRFPEILYRKRVLSVIQRNHMSGIIIFTGIKVETNELYCMADLVVFPAKVAHQARPIVEAGAMGKPIIIPDFEELREFVKNGCNGMSYDAGSVSALACAIETLLVDKNKAQFLGENNRKITLEKHTESERKEAVLDFFNQY